MDQMTQHESGLGIHVVEDYNMEALGAPFTVVLKNGVSKKHDPKTGAEKIIIPDLKGLIGAVVRSRVLHPRKLGGDEVKFLRKSLGIKAKDLAEFLGMTPEHFSRCENGTKVLAPSSEKLFRILAFAGSHHETPSDLLVLAKEPKSKVPAKSKASKAADSLLTQFLSMKIETVFDPDDGLHFEFVRRVRQEDAAISSGQTDDDGWVEPIKDAA